MRHRVLRVLEYTYENTERMLHDMELWAVQGTKQFGKDLTVRSAVVSLTGIEVEYEQP